LKQHLHIEQFLGKMTVVAPNCQVTQMNLSNTLIAMQKKIIECWKKADQSN